MQGHTANLDIPHAMSPSAAATFDTSVGLSSSNVKTFGATVAGRGEYKILLRESELLRVASARSGLSHLMLETDKRDDSFVPRQRPVKQDTPLERTKRTKMSLLASLRESTRYLRKQQTLS
jgi:hypothetical protein